LLALVLVPAASANHTNDRWEGTWRVASGAFATTLVLRPPDAARAQAPSCGGAATRAFYTGTYAGGRSGTIAACADRYALRGVLFEAGKRVGDVTASWALEVAPDGTVGAGTFEGDYSTGGGRTRWSATWVNHASPATADCAQWDVTGMWQTLQTGGYSIIWSFSQTGTRISGTATLTPEEAARAGYTGEAVGRLTRGALVRDRLDVVVQWPPRSNGSVTRGEYVGTVAAVGAGGRAQVEDGQAWGLANPSAKVKWSGSGDATCTNRKTR
jgi:hypothetical protein